jgi:hypothetical protein
MPIKTIEEYKGSSQIVLPYKAESIPGACLNEMIAHCLNCGLPTHNLRGTITEFNKNCLIVDFAIYCSFCSTISPFLMRWYPKDNRVMKFIEGEWFEGKMTMPISPKEKFKSFIKRFLSLRFNR